MSVTALPDPRLMLRDLLRSRWQPGSTGGITPRIHMGWYDESAPDPQITIGEPDESAAGGETGFMSLHGPGGLTQQIAGLIDLELWAHRDMPAVRDAQVNPRALLWAMGREIERIVLEHATADEALLYLTIRQHVGLPPDTERTPAVFRRSITVAYGWLRHAQPNP